MVIKVLGILCVGNREFHHIRLRGIFSCHLLKTIANSLGPDQDQQNVWPDLDSNSLTL